MNKNKFVIFIIVLSILFFCFMGIKEDKKEVNHNDDLSSKKLNSLKNIIVSSEHFDNAIYKANYEENKLTINDEFIVYVKDNYYSMNLLKKENNLNYCKIVDAIEMSLGGEKNKSIDTCLKTINKEIDLGGISVEDFDTYKILTVSSNELAKMITDENKHDFNELISLDEVNYFLENDDYLISSPNIDLNKEERKIKICFNLFTRNKKINLLFNFYNHDKKNVGNEYLKLDDKITKNITNICIDKNYEDDEISYFDIK